MHPTQINIKKITYNKYYINLIYNYENYHTTINNFELKSKLITLDKLENIISQNTLNGDLKFKVFYNEKKIFDKQKLRDNSILELNINIFSCTKKISENIIINLIDNFYNNSNTNIINKHRNNNIIIKIESDILEIYHPGGRINKVGWKYEQPYKTPINYLHCSDDSNFVESFRSMLYFKYNSDIRMANRQIFIDYMEICMSYISKEYNINAIKISSKKNNDNNRNMDFYAIINIDNINIDKAKYKIDIIEKNQLSDININYEILCQCFDECLSDIYFVKYIN